VGLLATAGYCHVNSTLRNCSTPQLVFDEVYERHTLGKVLARDKGLHEDGATMIAKLSPAVALIGTLELGQVN